MDIVEEARRVFPGGVNSPARALPHLPRPLTALRAEGPYLYADVGRLTDFCMGFGPLILGHRPKAVLDAVREALENGWLYALLTEVEVELGRKIVEHVPSIDMVRFVNSGTEATMNAIRLARAVTGRDLIVKFDGNFHGSHDYVLVKAGSGAATWGTPTSSGIPGDVVRTVIVVPYNEPEPFMRAMKEHGERVAAVIVEPIAANYGLLVPDRDYVKLLREETARHGSLLIFDEVVTGFRVGLGGAQAFYGVLPDITTLGKVIGGGFPIGAFGGKREYMSLVAPSGPMYNAGTFNAHPISMVAGLATIRELERGDAYRIADSAASLMAEGIEEIAGAKGIDVSVNRAASMFQLFFARGPVRTPEDVRKSNVDRYLSLHSVLVRRGVYLAPSQYETNFTSAAHSEDVVAESLSAIRAALDEVK